MPPIPADTQTPEQRAAIDAFKAARGADASMNGPWVPLLRSPELMQRVRAVGDYARFTSTLPPRLSEFVILLTARYWSQQYEWDTHYPIAVQAGVTRETALAIAERRRPSAMTEDETILYDLCSELQQTHRVSDATYGRALARFGEKGVIDAVGIAGYYSLLGMMLNVAQSPTVTPPGVPILEPGRK